MLNTDDIDKFGHCCKCHRNLIVRRVVDGKVQNTLAPEFGQTEFLMNNGSRLVVCMCKICQNTYDLSDKGIQKEIMEAVEKGWQLEHELMVKNGTITEEIAKEELEKRKDLLLEMHSEGISDAQIQGRQKVIAEMIKNDKENKIGVIN